MARRLVEAVGGTNERAEKALNCRRRARRFIVVVASSGE
jgi:hypothetical protein